MSAEADLVEILSTLQGEGLYVGARQVFVRLAGCNLVCVYCDTPGAHGGIERCRVEKSAGADEFFEVENPLSPESVAREVRRLFGEAPHHSVSWTGGEPLWSVEFLEETLSLLEDLPQYLETNGTLPEEAARLRGRFDYIAADIKLPSLTRGATGFSQAREFFRACKGPGLFAKIVVARETSADEFSEAVRVLDEAPGAPLVIQPVTKIEGGPGPPGANRLFELQALASRTVHDVRVIPQTQGLLGVP